MENKKGKKLLRKNIEMEIQVGLFVSIGVLLSMLAIIVLGGGQSLFTAKRKYTTHVKNVDGLIPGAKVILGGISVGTIDDVAFDMADRSIRIDFNVDKSSVEWIRTDSTVEIATQGVLGDKYLSVKPGSLENPGLPPGSDIPSQGSKDLSELLNKGDGLMLSITETANSLNRILKDFETDRRSDQFFKNLTEVSKNLAVITGKLSQEVDQVRIKSAIGHVDSILEKINNGDGTIGALINDPSLYDELRALLGGANRNRVIRNLVRQTIRDSEAAAAATPQPEPTKK